MGPDFLIPVACHAPSLTDEMLERYLELINGLPASPVRSIMETCYDCTVAWWNARETTRKATQRIVIQSGRKYDILPFDEDLVEQLFDVTPWPYEVKAMAAELDKIVPGELRDAAHMLHWYAEQISRDREPPTIEKLIDAD